MTENWYLNVLFQSEEAKTSWKLSHITVDANQYSLVIKITVYAQKKLHNSVQTEHNKPNHSFIHSSLNVFILIGKEMYWGYGETERSNLWTLKQPRRLTLLTQGNTLSIRASELSGSGSATLYDHMYAFRCKYVYVPAGKRSINLDTFNTFDDRVKKRVREPRLPPPSCLHPTIPAPFALFLGCHRKNYRITLLQSLSKHRQIPHQPWPRLWQDDGRCTATGSVRCPSERSPSSNLHICPGCVNDHSVFDKHVFFFFFTRTAQKIIHGWVMQRKCQLPTSNLLEGICGMSAIIHLCRFPTLITFARGAYKSSFQRVSLCVYLCVRAEG